MRTINTNAVRENFFTRKYHTKVSLNENFQIYGMLRLINMDVGCCHVYVHVHIYVQQSQSEGEKDGFERGWGRFTFLVLCRQKKPCVSKMSRCDWKKYQQYRLQHSYEVL